MRHGAVHQDMLHIRVRSDNDRGTRRFHEVIVDGAQSGASAVLSKRLMTSVYKNLHRI